MGLDFVELVMAIEDEFQIRIPNDVAPRLLRVGDFHSYVVKSLSESGRAVDPDEVWVRLKDVILRECPVREEHITPQAHIIEDFGLD
jgi:acyl carrier protein